jgi:hypothetical protein
MANNFYDKNESYDIPSTSDYMSFVEGKNVFRILGSFSDKTAIMGVEYWRTVEGKRTPVRLKKNNDGTYPPVPVEELGIDPWGNPEKAKYFWAFPVWNYAEKRVQILEITQKKSILNVMKAYIENPKWGDPREYDLIVTRGKEGDQTVYDLTVDPKEKLDKNILERYQNTFINISALFTGDDPFQLPGGKKEGMSNAVSASL